MADQDRVIREGAGQVMRIEGRGPLAAAAAAQPRRGVTGERFSLGAGPSRPTSAAAAAGLATVDALLALQGEESPAERRRRHARRGHDLLDGLDRLKAALLAGRVPAEALARLAERLALAQGSSGDPGLDAVVDQIALRAAVELAKLRAG